MDLEAKIKALEIAPITDEIKEKHLKPFEEGDSNIELLKYFKIYGETPMFYTQEYLENNSLEKLLAADEKNKKIFQPPLFFKKILLYGDREWEVRVTHRPFFI